MADAKDGKEDGKDVVRADADTNAGLDKVLGALDAVMGRLDSVSTRLDTMGVRMDSFEAARADDDKEPTEEEKAAAAAKAKADAEEAEKEKAKADADAAAAKAKADADAADKARADAATLAGIDTVRSDIKRIESMLPLSVSDKDYAALADAQAKADHVYQAFGDAASRPLQGESLLAYRRRMATGLKSHSHTWKDVDLLAIADSTAFDAIEKQVYADALHAAHNPTDLPEGQLRALVSVDSTGRRITTWAGRPASWMSSFSSNRRLLTGIGSKDR